MRRQFPYNTDVILEQPKVDAPPVHVVQVAELAGVNQLLHPPDRVVE